MQEPNYVPHPVDKHTVMPNSESIVITP
jgi:hypothetical protein